MTSVGSILGGAFGLLRERPGAVAIWCLLYIGASAAMALLMAPVAQMPPVPAGSDPQAGLAAIQAMFGRLLLLWLFLIVLLTVLYAAAQRAVLWPRESGFAYLRFGMDEVRLMALGLILVIAFIVLLFLLVILLVLFAALLALAAGPGAAIPLAILLYIVMLAIVVWLEVRLSLVFSLTLLRRRIIIGESWRLTRGRFWTLFGAYFVLVLIVIAMSLAAAMVTGWPYMDELMRNGFSPEAMQAAAQRQMQEQLAGIGVMTVAGWIVSGLAGGITVALFGGAVATATRDLTGDVEGVADTFA